MAFDPKKPVTTRDGRKVTVLKTDLKDRQPIVAIIDAGSENESVEQFSPDGKFFTHSGESHLDLVNPTVKKTGYINVYAGRGKTPTVTYNHTKEAADAAASDDRTACVPITYEE